MSSKITSVGFIGAGKIATALARGVMAAGLLTKDRIIASAPSRQDIDNIEKLGINVTMNNEEAVKNSQVVFVAVKPHVVKRVLKEVSHCVTPDHLVISVAAGITLEKMENALPDGARVIRCMPNTPVVVREGVTIYSAGSSVHNGDRELVNYLMSSVGICQEMDEYYLDIITGLTGCGPSYMYMILDALADGGVWAGIPKNIALRLIAHTMMGSAKMVLDNGAHPAEDAVCSPGGASIQAIQVLEKGGLRGLMMDAVQTASKRSSELSRIENGESQDYALKRR